MVVLTQYEQLQCSAKSELRRLIMKSPDKSKYEGSIIMICLKN